MLSESDSKGWIDGASSVIISTVSRPTVLMRLINECRLSPLLSFACEIRRPVPVKSIHSASRLSGKLPDRPVPTEEEQPIPIVEGARIEMSEALAKKVIRGRV